MTETIRTTRNTKKTHVGLAGRRFHKGGFGVGVGSVDSRDVGLRGKYAGASKSSVEILERVQDFWYDGGGVVGRIVILGFSGLF